MRGGTEKQIHAVMLNSLRTVSTASSIAFLAASLDTLKGSEAAPATHVARPQETDVGCWTFPTETGGR